MPIRLIGTDTTDPRLPALVIAATQGTTSADLAPGDVLADAQAYTDAAVEAIIVEGGGMVGTTVDTDQTYRIIMFSDGTTRAIPVAAEDPDIPEDLDATVRVNSVKLTWTAADGATSYIVRRDGAQLATTTSTSYRDSTVTLSETYEYTVQSVSSYGLRSAQTAEFVAFIDPALNVAPVVEIRSWPTTIAVGNRAMIRVNAIDADAHVLATILGTDVGSLVATADPTVWILHPV